MEQEYRIKAFTSLLQVTLCHHRCSLKLTLSALPQQTLSSNPFLNEVPVVSIPVFLSPFCYDNGTDCTNILQKKYTHTTYHPQALSFPIGQEVPAQLKGHRKGGNSLSVGTATEIGRTEAKCNK